jgi:hypothetical protein
MVIVLSRPSGQAAPTTVLESHCFAQISFYVSKGLKILLVFKEIRAKKGKKEKERERKI